MAKWKCRYLNTEIDGNRGSTRPSKIPEVESFRQAVDQAFASHGKGELWTECLEGTWNDLEKILGAGRALGNMMSCLRYVQRKTAGQRDAGDLRNPRLALHGLLMKCVEDAEAGDLYFEDAEADAS